MKTQLLSAPSANDFDASEPINPIAASCLKVYQPVPQDSPSASEPENSKRTRHSLREMVDEVLAALKPRIEKTSVWVEVDEESGWYCDHAEIRTVLLSLIGRALDELPTGNAHLCIRSVADGPAHTRLEIIDNGPGIPTDQLRSIFKPGSKVVEDTNGCAIVKPSLFSVRNLVELHGGAISVESFPGEGTTFSLTLQSALPAELVA